MGDCGELVCFLKFVGQKKISLVSVLTIVHCHSSKLLCCLLRLCLLGPITMRLGSHKLP